MLKYLLAMFIIVLLIIVNILKNKTATSKTIEVKTIENKTDTDKTLKFKAIKNKITTNKLVILKIILIVLFLEVTVFNINSYRTDFGNLNYMGLAGEDLANKISITTDNTQYISIENIDSKVKSIYLELDNVEDKIIDYDIFYSDKSTSNRYLASKSYCEDVEKTKYSCISLSRKL